MQEYIRKSKNTDREEFKNRAERQAQEIIQNKQDYSPQTYAFGLEREYYLVDEANYLAQRDEDTCERAQCQYELGLHNVELACNPISDFSNLDNFRYRLRDEVDRIRDVVGNRLVVLDGCVSVSENGETIQEYMEYSEDYEGYDMPSNMTKDTYYALLDYDISNYGDAKIEHPNFTYDADGTMPISLTCSIQPHIQIPEVEKVPQYFAASIRACAPLLSVSTNSPYLPPSMYDEKPDKKPYSHSLRIQIQEQLLNQKDRNGMRIPKDIDSFEELVDKIASHSLYMPLLSEDAPQVDWAGNSYEFNHQQRTCWWWVNPRVGSSANGDGNAVRIELRPFPNQPTFQDNISLFCACAGAIVGMVEEEHPVIDLDWRTARDNLRQAERNGPNADLKWIDKNGERISENEQILQDVIQTARKGLVRLGMSEEEADRSLRHIKKRGIYSPSQWKADIYNQNLKDKQYEQALREVFLQYVNNMYRGKSFYRWTSG